MLYPGARAVRDLKEAVVEKVRNQGGTDTLATCGILLEDGSKNFHHANKHLILALCVRLNDLS